LGALRFSKAMVFYKNPDKTFLSFVTYTNEMTAYKNLQKECFINYFSYNTVQDVVGTM
jgi:hypothetical protein